MVLLKWSVPFISLSFLDCLFQYLSPIGRLYFTEKEVYEIPPCVLVQFVVEFTECAEIAVDVRFHHIHEDVVHHRPEQVQPCQPECVVMYELFIDGPRKGKGRRKIGQ